MTVAVNHEGSIIICELVTDQFSNEFYHERVYQGYTPQEARRIFRRHLKDEGLEVSK